MAEVEIRVATVPALPLPYEFWLAVARAENDRDVADGIPATAEQLDWLEERERRLVRALAVEEELAFLGGTDEG